MSCSIQDEIELCSTLKQFSNDPSKQNVKGEYRKFLLKNHPDKLVNKLKPGQAEKFVRIKDLYERCKRSADLRNDELCKVKQDAPSTPSKSTPSKSTPPDKASIKKALCLRKKANWSILKDYHRFESKKFNKKEMSNDILECSPKLDALLHKLKKIGGGKHVIFSDVETGYGAKMLISALISNGYQFTLNPKHKLMTGNLSAILSTPVYGKRMTKKLIHETLQKYNDRDTPPSSKYNIIVLDSGYKEGIDLFDVEHMHIFEEAKHRADLQQVIGRATRLCGQKGLPFKKNRGWKLNVYIYSLLDAHNSPVHQTFAKYMNYDIADFHITQELENFVAKNAVDSSLNYEINKFSDIIQRGGASRALTLSDSSLSILNSSLSRKGNPFKKQNSAYKYKPIKIKNDCVDKKSTSSDEFPRIAQFTPSQKFISDYFVPKSNQKGLLVWHSTGTGKTCTAIATKSKKWEEEDYTILWVTRTTLRNDIWKNMFDISCDIDIQKRIENDDFDSTKRMKYLNKKFLQPVSFKQLSNALGKKETQLTKKLIKLNGSDDPLKKTLIIIDEAHKLLDGSLSPTERPDFQVIFDSIQKSYKRSKNNSCRILLMTATPFAGTSATFCNLANMLVDSNFLPNTVDTIHQHFNSKYKLISPSKFKSIAKNNVSFLDRTRDPRQFAQVQIHHIESAMSMKPEIELRNCLKEKKQNVSECDSTKTNHKEIPKLEKELKQVQKNIDEKLKPKLEKVKTKFELKLSSAPRGTKTVLKKEMDEKIKDIKDTIKSESAKAKSIESDLKAHRSRKKKEDSSYKKCMDKTEKDYEKCMKENKKAKPASDLSQEQNIKQTCKIEL